ncbi:hypothetical protein, partial [Agathobaculum butyriciproducens]|uniref:hypothetical protein n=1 Tax=Agathobaculum butyriciproducens TaxID=1628085 RepID=UPI003AB7E096
NICFSLGLGYTISEKSGTIIKVKIGEWRVKKREKFRFAVHSLIFTKQYIYEQREVAEKESPLLTLNSSLCSCSFAIAER